MDSNNKYKKKLQEPAPQAPDKWADGDGEQAKGDGKGHVGQVQRGPRRWKDLPVPVDVS